jgi:hypothetical protein
LYFETCILLQIAADKELLGNLFGGSSRLQGRILKEGLPYGVENLLGW